MNPVDHYLDLTLLPNPEIAQPHLMAALFSKLHLALVAQRSEHIGICFPGVQASSGWLGDCLRLHGSQSDLSALMAGNWLLAMLDHVQATAVRRVPAGASFCVVSRVQAKSNPERQRRRQMRRHGITAEEALTRLPDSATEKLDLPYIQLRSQSTGQSFLLFIRHGEVRTTPTAGPFSSYGLSPTATIAWF